MANIKRDLFSKMAEYGIARGFNIQRRPGGHYFKKNKATGEFEPMGCRSATEVYAKMRWKLPVEGKIVKAVKPKKAEEVVVAPTGAIESN